MIRKFVHKKLSLLLLFIGATICSFSQVTSNKGRDFWVGYGHHQFMEQGSNAMNMRIYLSTDAQPAIVTVTIDSSGNPFLPVNTVGGIWRKTYNIPAYTAIQTDIIPKGPVNVTAAPGDVPSDPYWDARLYDLPPESGGAGGSGVFRNKGIHIESNVPITAYSHIYGTASSGATMLIPIAAWGYEYVSLNSNQSYASNCYSWTYVVASKDYTVLQITPSVKTRGQNRTGLSPGVTSTVTLMKGQIYQLIGANLASDVSGNGGTNSGGYSLSGTRIKSIAGPGGECFPIAVFAGSSRTSNAATCGSGGGDNDNQQLFPMHSWGKTYLLAPFSPSSNPAGAQTSIVKVAFSEPPPATQLRRNGVVLPVPAGSLFYTFETNTADLIEATKPIMVNQFMTGGNCMGGAGNVGDPEMVVVAPVEQAIKDVTFYRQSRESITTNYLTLIVPTAGIPSLRIDNSAAFDHTYPHPRNAILGKDYTVVVKRWDIGPGQGFQSRVRCDSAFNAITYGLGSVESYAYSAGALIVNLNALTGIHNQPDLGNGGQTIHDYTGVGTPMDLSILLKYQPDRLIWKFSEMNPLPGACMTATPVIAGDFTMDPAVNFFDGTVVVGTTTYYKYKLPHTITFNCTGIYELPVEAYSPGINNCGNRETFYPSIEVREQPITDFTYDNLTMCSKDTLYLEGPLSGLSGIIPQTMVRWEWFLPGGLTASQKDTAIVLPPGIHEIRMVAITDHGLLSDTVVKTITIYPPPTTVLTAVPDVVCTGQSITFTQTASYDGPASTFTNYYWNFGDNTILNNLNTTEIHTYAGPNSYIATAAVRISDLCIGDTVETIVIVSPEAQIEFTYPDECLPASGLAQFGAAATDLGGTPITSYAWDFGDPASGANNTSGLQNPTHTYTTFGSYSVTLSVVTSTGCAGDITIPLNFGPEPVLAYPAFTPVCLAAVPFSISTGSVTNGVPVTLETYSGPGVSGTTFDPAIAGVGAHIITYTVTTPTCTESTTQTITVLAPPVVNGGTYGPYCVNGLPVTLGGSPAGGTFSGPGVTGTTFNPATAGPGTHTITYSYTDGNGCIGSNNIFIVVNALPIVHAGTYAPVCVNSAVVALAGTPAGGIFSGPGVTGNNFNPAIAGVGSHSILYTYTDAAGCVGTDVKSIVVNPLPTVNAGSYTPVCLNGSTITLVGNPAGGIFSGPGVTGNIFDPSAAGTGSHTLTYNYSDANGCAASDDVIIVVNAIPVVNPGSYSSTCLVGAPITLAGTPAGGSFSGPGITGNTFNPATAGAGTHSITYTYTDGNGCTASQNTTITVFALPTANAGVYAPLCINAASITLAGSPAGGSFSGPGVTGNSFNPATAGVGDHLITYNYTDGSGCSATATVTIIVNPLPVVNAGTYTPVCLNGNLVNLAGTPAGGVFSGTGVSGNSFNPATAGTGSFTIVYTYTDVNGCVNSDDVIIIVNDIPVVNAGTYTAICEDAASITLAGTPAGGTFSGPGVTGTTFNPATAGPGSHTILYSYTDANGCTVSSTTIINVNPLPIVNAGIYTAVCIDASSITLAGTPAGGTFSGPGVTGSSFNPATAGVGTHTINYNYTNANGCSASGTTDITVNPIPALDAGTYPAVCINAAAITLAGTPAGGNFSGPGVTGNIFNPATAGVGTHIISYGGVAGCNNSTVTTTIIVNPLPVIIVATYPALCIDASPVVLTATPAGGTFSGPGVTGSTFDPLVAGSGSHTITYTYIDANSCSNTGTTTIIVNALPVTSAGSYSPLCINAGILTLNGTPAGGTYSGPGISGNSFDPAAAGVGTHSITYSYTDVNGCSSSNATTIIVNEIPTVSAGTYLPICAELAPITLAGLPAGGTFSGPGVSGTTFNPALAGPGIHTITYSYTANTGCSRTVSTTIQVYGTPTSTFTLDNSICVNEGMTLASTATGNIVSWTWDLGNGNSSTYINDNPFNVTYSTHNDYNISLVTTSDQGCVSPITIQVLSVHPLPQVNFDLPSGICMPQGNATFTNHSTVIDNSALIYEWDFGDLGSSTATNPTHTYAATGSYDVNLVATSAFGCSNHNMQTLDDFYDRPVANFVADPTELCQGTENSFTSSSSDPNGAAIVGYNWNFGDQTSPSTSASPLHTYNLPGNFVINLIVTNEIGCQSLPFPQTVTVHMQPVIDAGNSFVVAQGETIQFNATSNSPNFTFSWDPSMALSDPTALNPTLIANNDETYTLTATGDFGCSTNDFITVKILKPVKIPNVFTPNGDNIHDKWMIPNLIDYPAAKVEVFNRYGQQVFYSSGYNTPWDGTFKGKGLPAATYYYVIILGSGFKPISGSVTILK